MRAPAIASFLFACSLPALAQQPTVPRTPADSARARASADSLALVRELEAAAAADSSAAARQASPRLLPDVSAVGDLVADVSPDRSTQESGSRFAVREVEVALQAAVDPYFRGDVYLGFNDEEGAAVEQAFLTTTSLPWSLQLRLGRYLLPLGKLNTTHRHDLHTVEYPHVLQRFLGEEGLKGTGVESSRIGSPLGFFQELLVGVMDRLDAGGHGHGHEGEEELHPASPASDYLAGLGYHARLRNYWDLGPASNLELSFSAATGRVPVPLDRTVDDVNAVNARRTLFGGDLTFRWRPLQQGLYRSLLVQVEVLRQLNERSPTPPVAGAQLAEPARDYTGAYGFARWQLTRRGYVGVRADWLEDPELEGGTLRAGSVYYEFFPSEFSKLIAAFERVEPEDGGGETRLLLQATFALGPHRPHPF